MLPDTYLLSVDLHLITGIVAAFAFLGLAVFELGIYLRRLFTALAIEIERHDPKLLAQWDWPLIGAASRWGDRRQALRRELIEARVFVHGLPAGHVSAEAQRLARKYRLLSGACLILSLMFWYGIFAYEIGRHGWDLFNILGVAGPIVGIAAIWLLVPRWPQHQPTHRNGK